MVPLDDTATLLQYVTAFQKDSFQDVIIRTVKGRTQIVAKLVGIPVKTFKPVRSPYTRQFLRHMPTEEPQVLKAAHDHKSSAKKPSRSGKAVQESTRKRKG